MLTLVVLTKFAIQSSQGADSWTLLRWSVGQFECGEKGTRSMDLKSILRILEFISGLIDRNQSAKNKKTSPTVIVNGDIHIHINKSDKD